MDNSRFLDCLTADFERLRSVAPLDLGAAVPSCPGWTVADLTRHVGEVYLHKVAAMRDGVEPEPWPPKEFADEDPLALLDRGYTELRGEFAARKPEDPAGSWYEPDQTVGFWFRRMAQETVIHRVDAELGTGQPVAPIPDDLAVDGVDELLKIFVAYSVREWAQFFAGILADSPGRTYRLRTDGAAWRVRTGPGEFTVAGGAGEGTAGGTAGGAGEGAGEDSADLTVTGPPAALLRWAWNREGGEPSGVTVEGPAEALAELRACITEATG